MHGLEVPQWRVAWVSPLQVAASDPQALGYAQRRRSFLSLQDAPSTGSPAGHTSSLAVAAGQGVEVPQWRMAWVSPLQMAWSVPQALGYAQRRPSFLWLQDAPSTGNPAGHAAWDALDRFSSDESVAGVDAADPQPAVKRARTKRLAAWFMRNFVVDKSQR